MTDIAILTPDPSDHSYADLWPGVLSRLSEALSKGGLTASPRPWTDHVEDASGLADFPLVLPLLVWGYHRDPALWLRACATWEAAGLPLANPAAVLRWNADKSYLARLSERGVPIPPTIWTDSPTNADIEAAFAATGAAELIVKPRVSAGAWKTLRLRPGEVLTDAPVGPAMIQPFLPTIQTAGETSLLFFGGRLSHIVNKRPVGGDFRIQVQFGGLYETMDEPPPGALEVALKVLEAMDEPLLYARIDLAPDVEGNWLLMEAELIEPDFYLGSTPDGGALFAHAVCATLRG